MNLASARQSPLAVRTAMLGPVEAPPLATRRVLIAMHVSPQVFQDSHNAERFRGAALDLRSRRNGRHL